MARPSVLFAREAPMWKSVDRIYWNLEATYRYNMWCKPFNLKC